MARKKKRRWSNVKRYQRHSRAQVNTGAPGPKTLSFAAPAKDYVVPNKDVIKEYAKRVRPYNYQADQLAEAWLRIIFGNAIPKLFHPDPNDSLSKETERAYMSHEQYRAKLFEILQEVEPQHNVVVIPGRLWLIFTADRRLNYFLESSRGTVRRSINYTKDRAEQIIRSELSLRIDWKFSLP